MVRRVGRKRIAPNQDGRADMAAKARVDVILASIDMDGTDFKHLVIRVIGVKAGR